MKVRLAISPCPNDTFVFYALLHGQTMASGIEWQPTFIDIEQLNQHALGTTFDVTKISLALYPRVQNHYRLLQVGWTLGNQCGPLLIARDPKHTLSHATRVAVPGPLTTAALLLRRYFPQCNRWISMPYWQIEEAVASGAVPFGVLIHECRFTYEQKGLTLIADLGALWEQETHLPVPLAALVAHHALPPSVVEQIEQGLRDSYAFAHAHPEQTWEFVRQHAQIKDDTVIRKHIELYVNNHFLGLSAQAQLAVATLMQQAGAGGDDSTVRPGSETGSEKGLASC